MNATFEYRRLTVEDALRILRADHALMIELDEAEDIEIDLNSPIINWFCYDDFSRAWVFNAHRLERMFQINIPLPDWKPVLTPPKKKTIRDLCEFLAANATFPCIPEPRPLGRRCKRAGAFLTIKGLLEKQGTDTRRLRPSTALARFADDGLPEIAHSILRVAPQLWTRYQPEYPRFPYLCFALILLLGTILLPVGAAVSPWFILAAVMSFCGFLYVWHRSETDLKLPRRVTFDDLHDFRDLCRAITSP